MYSNKVGYFSSTHQLDWKASLHTQTCLATFSSTLIRRDKVNLMHHMRPNMYILENASSFIEFTEAIPTF